MLKALSAPTTPTKVTPANIVPFSKHLGADEQVNIAGMGLRQNAFEIVPPADGISIESRHARFRENAL